MRRLLALAAAATALLVVPSGASAACANEDAGPSADRAALRAAVLCLTNEARTTRGLRPLTAAPKLDQAAQLHADAMIALGFFDHDAPDGTGPGDRVAAVAYAFSAWGENIATGHETPREVVLAWMESVGHCHNVLSPQFTELGIGVSPLGGRSGGGMWGQLFGRPAGVRAPSTDTAPSESCPQGTIAGPGSGAPAAPVTPAVDTEDPECIVPQLRGLTLSAARRELADAGCALGSVQRSGRGRSRLRVVSQTVRPGTQLAPRTLVGMRVSPAASPS